MTHDPRIIKHDPIPDTTHDPYFTTEKAVDAAHFWWNHLTYLQRMFIVNSPRFTEHDCFVRDVPEWAYKTSGEWHTMEGWPS